MLKKIGLGLLTGLVIMSGSAFAASSNWQLVREEAGNKIYVDTGSINKKGSLLKMTEKEEIAGTTTNSKNKLTHKEFNTEKKQWRTTATEVLNAKGKKLAGQKGQGKWSPITKGSQAAADVQLCEDYGQKQGPWSYVKDTGSTAAKFFNPSSLKKGKNDSLEVWEKLELKKETNGVKTIISHVRYFPKTGKASTLYNCEFSSKGRLLKAGPAVDEWGVSDDVYGEYIGNDLVNYLGGKRKK